MWADAVYGVKAQCYIPGSRQAKGTYCRKEVRLIKVTVILLQDNLVRTKKIKRKYKKWAVQVMRNTKKETNTTKGASEVI